MVETDAHPVICPAQPFQRQNYWSKLDEVGKTISFLQGWDMLLNVLAETHFYRAGCKDMKNSVYNGKADTILNMSFH